MTTKPAVTATSANHNGDLVAAYGVLQGNHAPRPHTSV